MNFTRSSERPMRTMEVETGIDEGHVSREKEQNLDEGPW